MLSCHCNLIVRHKIGLAKMQFTLTTYTGLLLAVLDKVAQWIKLPSRKLISCVCPVNQQNDRAHLLQEHRVAY